MSKTRFQVTLFILSVRNCGFTKEKPTGVNGRWSSPQGWMVHCLVHRGGWQMVQPTGVDGRCSSPQGWMVDGLAHRGGW